MVIVVGPLKRCDQRVGRAWRGCAGRGLPTAGPTRGAAAAPPLLRVDPLTPGSPSLAGPPLRGLRALRGVPVSAYMIARDMILLDGSSLTLDDLVAIAYTDAQVALADHARARV